MFNAVAVPARAASLQQLLPDALVALTGRTRGGDEQCVHVERDALGGLSAGMVSTGFGRSTAVPWRLARYAALATPASDWAVN